MNFFKRRTQPAVSADTERTMQVRQTQRRIRKHIDKQLTAERRLKQLAQRALDLGDDRQFSQIARQILWTRNDVASWERYLVAVQR